MKYKTYSIGMLVEIDYCNLKGYGIVLAKNKTPANCYDVLILKNLSSLNLYRSVAVFHCDYLEQV